MNATRERGGLILFALLAVGALIIFGVALDACIDNQSERDDLGYQKTSFELADHDWDRGWDEDDYDRGGGDGGYSEGHQGYGGGGGRSGDFEGGDGDGDRCRNFCNNTFPIVPGLRDGDRERDGR